MQLKMSLASKGLRIPALAYSFSFILDDSEPQMLIQLHFNSVRVIIKICETLTLTHGFTSVHV